MKVNEQIAAINQLTKATRSDVIPAPDISSILEVFNLLNKSYHVIFVHEIDYRTPKTPVVDKVAVFSKPPYAPFASDNLQLATPAHYRREEALNPGIGDPYDGTLTRDASEWATSIVNGPVRARISFASSGEPWVYCASHFRTREELHRLWNHFQRDHDYSEATQIHDPNSFAAWLAIDFAITLDKSTDVILSDQDIHIYDRTSYNTSLWEGTHHIDSLVHVYHGPVRYEDTTGRVDTQDQFFDPLAGPRAWFTKKCSFHTQSEYRFAIATIGVPAGPKTWIKMSPELRRITSKLHR
ncbi:MAG: hypothetical protein OXG08_06115 [Gammaproteobacteria bacterium]|nr:hypothetical protein [Gammaproteobacteria bacterium]